MNTTLKPWGIWKHTQFNMNSYPIVKKLCELDSAFKVFVLDAYGRASFRGLNNSYKTLKYILSRRKTQALQKLYNLHKLTMTQDNTSVASVSVPTTAQDTETPSPQQRLEKFLKQLHELPPDYYNASIKFLDDDTVLTPEVHKAFNDSYDVYEEKQRQYQRALTFYQKLCALNGLDKPKNLPIECTFTI